MLSFVGDAQWTDQQLEEMREVGDDSADMAIELWKQDPTKMSVRELAKRLVGFEQADEIDKLIDGLSARPGMATGIDPRLRD